VRKTIEPTSTHTQNGTMYPLIATPTHDGKLFKNYVISMLNAISAFTSAQIRAQVLLLEGESLVTRARNNCVAHFLANPEWTHLFWIDSDIGFTPEAALRLLNSGYDVAAGVYPLKRENWPDDGLPTGTTLADFETNYTRYTVNHTASTHPTDIQIAVQPDGFVKLSEAPTGFMVIKRSVFERLMTHYPHLRYRPDGIGDVDNGLHYRFFDVMVDPVSQRYLSEDYGFCRLWTGLGESVYVDARSDLTHQGSKLYRGNFAQTLLHALPNAVGASTGKRLILTGREYLQPPKTT